MTIKVIGFGRSRGFILASSMWNIIKHGEYYESVPSYYWPDVRITVETQKQPRLAIEVSGIKRGLIGNFRRMLGKMGLGYEIKIRRTGSGWICRFPPMPLRQRKRFLPFYVWLRGRGPK